MEPFVTRCDVVSIILEGTKNATAAAVTGSTANAVEHSIADVIQVDEP